MNWFDLWTSDNNYDEKAMLDTVDNDTNLYKVTIKFIIVYKVYKDTLYKVLGTTWFTPRTFGYNLQNIQARRLPFLSSLPWFFFYFFFFFMVRLIRLHGHLDCLSDFSSSSVFFLIILFFNFSVWLLAAG